MLQKYFTVGDYDYMFRYEVPESFFDEQTLKYLSDKVSRKIIDYQKEIDIDRKACVNGGDKKYHRLREYFYTVYKLKPAEVELYRIRNKFDFKFGEKKNKTVIDINAIKENVKCWDILGKPEREDGNRMWYKLRDERTASCCVYKETNSFYDFGSGTGGDIFILYQLLNNCDFKTAIKELSNNYD
jgi:hypothetical protein